MVMENKYNKFVFENHGRGTRYNGPLNIAPTVTVEYVNGGNNMHPERCLRWLLQSKSDDTTFIVENERKSYCI